MNTEPPTGDDLNRMLVSMKQNVLARADEQRPRPKRRGRRAGIVIGVIAVLAIGATSGGVALGMIPQPFAAAPAPAPSAAPVEPSETPTRSSAPVVEEPTNTPTPSTAQVAGVIPTDCRQLVPQTDYDRLFGGAPLDDPAGTAFGDDGTLPAPTLWCIWRDPRADVSGIDIRIGTQPVADQAATLASLESESGYTCSDRDGGRFCQMTMQAEPYPVDTTYTYYVRGTTWVLIHQTNAPTTGLLAAVEQQVWG